MKTQIFRAGRIVKHECLRMISIGCILLFAILPLLTLAFHVTRKDWAYIVSDNSFWNAIKNSLIYTGAAAVITTVLALIAAYLLETSSLRKKNLQKSMKLIAERPRRRPILK